MEAQTEEVEESEEEVSEENEKKDKEKESPDDKDKSKQIAFETNTVSSILGHAQVENTGCENVAQVQAECEEKVKELLDATSNELVSELIPKDDHVPSINIETLQSVDQTDLAKVTSSRWKLVKVVILVVVASLWTLLGLYCYLYISTICYPVEVGPPLLPLLPILLLPQLWCPTPTLTFPARACCSALWLWLGAPVSCHTSHSYPSSM